ncbi:hypothetical protein EHQ24_09655 [Leptospira noumeaensis]|uniref:Uncharacterized protein n=1 Tax=Leptospira noumeaensis TaxID=2484964 RepID=A0A4R9I6E3_9LEPT|nr:hypothetical protein [Leptospira noumeaensis]TGK81563.1 hypothetical protein EHQ24_09655 [Leptospira noumeaensis]
MKRSTILFFILLLSSYCISYKSSFKEISIIEKFASSKMIEVKVNAPYDLKIVNIFQSLKKENQQVTLSFDGHSILGFENRNRVILDANIKINEKNITYYSINLYKVAGKEILIYPFNYSKLLWSVTFFSLGLIPTDEEFEVIFELSVSKSERDTKKQSC